MSLSMLIFRWKHVIKYQFQKDFINYCNDISIESDSFGKLAFLIELRRFISNIYIYLNGSYSIINYFLGNFEADEVRCLTFSLLSNCI